MAGWKNEGFIVENPMPTARVQMHVPPKPTHNYRTSHVRHVERYVLTQKEVMDPFFTTAKLGAPIPDRTWVDRDVDELQFVAFDSVTSSSGPAYLFGADVQLKKDHDHVVEVSNPFSDDTQFKLHLYRDNRHVSTKVLPRSFYAVPTSLKSEMRL